MSLLGILGRGFGSTGAGSPPATPTLTWADDTDGTGGVATIAASTAGSTNQLYYMRRTGSAWTLGGSRSGNGTISLTLTTGNYLGYVLSTTAGGTKASAIVALPVTNATATGRVQQICEALVTLLETADTAGAFAATLGAARAYTTLLDVSGCENLDVLVVPAMTTRTRTAHGTYRRDVVIEILLRQHLTNDALVDAATTDAKVYLLEQIDDYLADPDNHDLTLPDGTLASYVEPTDNRAASDIRDGMGLLWLREHLQDLRQVTSIVRVAYAIDVSY